MVPQSGEIYDFAEIFPEMIRPCILLFDHAFGIDWLLGGKCKLSSVPPNDISDDDLTHNPIKLFQYYFI